MRKYATVQNKLILIVLVLAVLLGGCAQPVEVELQIPKTSVVSPSSTPTDLPPTATQPPPKTLVVCLADEPQSLYLYADQGPSATAVRQALYDGPFDVLGYDYAPVILRQIPSLSGDDARVLSVAVSEGQPYFNPETSLPDYLGYNKAYLPSGCSTRTCMARFSGGDVQMDQMVVEFELLEGLLWSDGEPLKASDSVYSFQLDADAATPTTKYMVQRTQSYHSLDEQRVEWTGIPGFMDAEYASNFWSPLPQHVLGNASAADLLSLESATQKPLGWGPYILDEWTQGTNIKMVRNAQYFRASEGLPYFDELIFRFLNGDDGLEQVQTGECDLLAEEAIALETWQAAAELDAKDVLNLVTSPGYVLERMDMQILPPWTTGLAPLFADVRTRRAVGACIDQESIMEEIFLGWGSTTDSYLPVEHPAYLPAREEQEQPVDPDALLWQAGWVDEDGDPETPRIAQGVVSVPQGTAFQFDLLSADDPLQLKMAALIAEDLAECGLQATVHAIDDQALFAPWPEGMIFGLQFESVLWAWPTFSSPSCEAFAGFEVPGSEQRYGINASGYADGGYDAACEQILWGRPQGDLYMKALQQTQENLRDRVPFVPLGVRPRVMVAGPDLCGPQLDPSVWSGVWNIETYASGEGCQTP